MSPTQPSPVEAGRAALSRRDWPAAFRWLSQADAESLVAADLEGLADAAWGVADYDASRVARERAFAAYDAANDAENAAWTALFVSAEHFLRGDHAVASGWRGTADRYMADLPEGRPHARRLCDDAYLNIQLGAPEAAITMAADARALARRVGERNIEMWALQLEGQARAICGDPGGRAQMDEAMVAVITDQLASWAAGPIACGTISTYQELAEFERAAEWLESSERAFLAHGQEMSSDCRIHRAGILRLQGSWARAEAEARIACQGTSLSRNLTWHTGWGWCEVGEIRLRMGDLEGAEDAFGLAHQRGYPPHPGMALLRLAQGEHRLAAEAIARAREQVGDDRLKLARLVEAAVEIALVQGDVERGRACVVELESLLQGFNAAPLRASVLCTSGNVQLAEGDPHGAIAKLSEGVALLLAASLPYEAARARTGLAAALRAAGDLDGARMEWSAAHAAFEELGAELDRHRISTELANLESTMPNPQAGRSTRKSFLFTDIERSTALSAAMGEDGWDEVLRQHDRLLREAIREHRGSVVKHQGDGMFATFDAEGDAIASAITMQRMLERHRSDREFLPAVRIGVHAGTATERHGDFFGMAVNVAARVMSIADGGQIFATAATAEDAGHDTSSVREIELRGVTEPMRVVEIDWSS